jgi:uncharacterized protein (TIGR03790 family)
MMTLPFRVFTFSAFLSVQLVAPAYSQSTDYSDVVILVNSNSALSVAIGAYFQSARNIPEENVIAVDAPLEETIGSDVFDTLIVRVREQLLLLPTIADINYIVTTKGLPVRIEDSDCDTLNQYLKCSALESELALLLGPWEGSIRNLGSLSNPYLNSNVHQDRSQTGIFLVTRLDAMTGADVYDLIDRSGPELPIDRSSAQVIGDIGNINVPTPLQFFVDQMTIVLAPLNDLEWNTVIEASENDVSGATEVATLIFLDLFEDIGIPDVDWTSGAIAFDWGRNSAWSYEPDANAMRRRTGELISSGATGARGNVAPIFGNQNIQMQATLERYLDTAYHFNLAESMYAGIPSLSWMYQVVGDPKTSITLSATSGIEEGAIRPDLTIYPNPASGMFVVRSAGHLKDMEITDSLGRSVQFTSDQQGSAHTVKLEDVVPGLYHVRCSDQLDRLMTGTVLVD